MTDSWLTKWRAKNKDWETTRKMALLVGAINEGFCQYEHSWSAFMIGVSV